MPRCTSIRSHCMSLQPAPVRHVCTIAAFIVFTTAIPKWQGSVFNQCSFCNACKEEYHFVALENHFPSSMLGAFLATSTVQQSLSTVQFPVSKQNYNGTLCTLFSSYLPALGLVGLRSLVFHAFGVDDYAGPAHILGAFAIDLAYDSNLTKLPSPPLHLTTIRILMEWHSRTQGPLYTQQCGNSSFAKECSSLTASGLPL